MHVLWSPEHHGVEPIKYCTGQFVLSPAATSIDKVRVNLYYQEHQNEYVRKSSCHPECMQKKGKSAWDVKWNDTPDCKLFIEHDCGMMAHTDATQK